MDSRVSFSFVDVLDRIKYYLLAGIGIVLLAVSGILFYVYSAQAYSEKAMVLLEAVGDDYTTLLEQLQNAEENKTEDAEDATDEKDSKPTQESVLASLSEVIATYPKSFAAQKAQVQSGTIFLHGKEYEKARDMFFAAATRRSKTYLNPIAYLHAAIAQEDIDVTSANNSSTKAVEYYQSIVDLYPKSIAVAHAYFSLGRLAEQSTDEESKRLARARSYYKTLVENNQFRDSQWAALAQSRLVVLDSQEQ